MENLQFTFSINKPLETVWNQLTTPEGITAFFCPRFSIDFHPGGRFELFFLPEAPEGEQGSEGMRIMAMDRPNLFSFTWKSPPIFPRIRGQQTYVRFLLQETEGEEPATEVQFLHTGFGTGEDWEKNRNYFDTAWGDRVLPKLKYSLEEGPVDWDNRPEIDRRYLDYRKSRI